MIGFGTVDQSWSSDLKQITVSPPIGLSHIDLLGSGAHLNITPKPEYQSTTIKRVTKTTQKWSTRSRTRT